MARLTSTDFASFVAERERARGVGRDPHGYAYHWDRSTRAAFEAVGPVSLAVAAGVRLFETLERAKLLGQAVKVGPRQFPRVHELVRSAADTLGIPEPTVYVSSAPTLNGATYGTRDSSFILLHSALVDHFDDAELATVIGHECGHIHNDHVVYLTTLHMLTQVAGLFVRFVSLPATLALRAWSRRAEITCDRAGALCSGDLAAASRALTKLALGSQKLYAELDVEAFLEQHEEARENPGRLAELGASHPWLPKRVLALREFEQSEIWQRRQGRSGGRSMSDVDARVHEIVKVLG